MRHWRLLLISIFIIATLSTSSLAAIRTVTYYSSLFADSTPPGEFVDWTDNFTFPYFDPAMGELISVYFTATLNATLEGAAENRALTPVQNAYFAVDAYMDAVMINGQHIPLQVYLRVPKTGGINVTAFDGVWDFLGTSSFNGSDANDTWGYVYYDDSANTTDYVGTGTFPLLAYTRASSRVVGGGSWYSLITTLAWSNASITYTYDDARCLSGFKKDGCTGLPLSGWNITVRNATTQWNATTDASGFWQVCKLENDNYTVCEILQPGWNQTDPEACHTVTLGGINITDINFTNQRLLCISGHKKNTCGQFNLSNWTIVLTNSLGGAMSALTNETGYYQFCGLPPGIYNLSEEPKEGWSPVYVPQQVTLNCSNISGMDFVNSECCGSSLKINKTADFGPSPGNPAGVNQAINYTIIVENTGNETLYQVNVTDDKLGLREEIASLLPGEFRIFNARYVVAEIDLCGNITNIAWANATDPCSKTFHVNASWNVPTSYTAAIEIDKRADVSSAKIGDVINYTYTVTNTGDVNLSDLKIEDDRLGMIDERK